MRTRVAALWEPRTASVRTTRAAATRGAVAGIRVGADISWLFGLGLVTWTLADTVLPAAVEGRTATAYWAAGFLGALGLSVALAFHEAGHCWAAGRAGLRTRAVMLSAFGGVTTFDREPPSPGAALAVAVGGPLGSLAATAAATLTYVVLVVADADPLGTAAMAVVTVASLLVGLVNLVPALPLDGGHILRALLWAIADDAARAARMARVAARWIGLAAIALAVVASASGETAVALWASLLGLVVYLD